MPRINSAMRRFSLAVLVCLAAVAFLARAAAAQDHGHGQSPPMTPDMVHGQPAAPQAQTVTPPMGHEQPPAAQAGGAATQNQAMAPDMGHQHPAAPPPDAKVGVEEKLGAMIPADVVFADEAGNKVNLKDLIKLPTILAPVYYSCPNDCNLLLGSLSQILPKVALEPGKEYEVITFSFDETDTPAIAARRKNDFLTALSGPFPPAHWKFLTGDEANIRKLTDALGFHFKRDGKSFLHSVILVSVSPSGKITRYLYGTSPLPFDIAMAATEAAGETVGLSVKRAVSLCYTYDPKGRRYVFDLMKVTGAGVLAGLGIFVLFLVFGGKKRKTQKPKA